MRRTACATPGTRGPTAGHVWRVELGSTKQYLVRKSARTVLLENIPPWKALRCLSNVLDVQQNQTRRRAVMTGWTVCATQALQDHRAAHARLLQKFSVNLALTRIHRQQEMPPAVSAQQTRARLRAARPPPTALATRATQGPTATHARRARRARTRSRQEMPPAVTVQRTQARPRAARPRLTARAMRALRGLTAGRACRARRARTRRRQEMPPAVTVQRTRARPRAAQPRPTARAMGATRALPGALAFLFRLGIAQTPPLPGPSASSSAGPRGPSQSARMRA